MGVEKTVGGGGRWSCEDTQADRKGLWGFCRLSSRHWANAERLKQRHPMLCYSAVSVIFKDDFGFDWEKRLKAEGLSPRKQLSCQQRTSKCQTSKVYVGHQLRMISLKSPQFWWCDKAFLGVWIINLDISVKNMRTVFLIKLLCLYTDYSL